MSRNTITSKHPTAAYAVARVQRLADELDEALEDDALEPDLAQFLQAVRTHLIPVQRKATEALTQVQA